MRERQQGSIESTGNGQRETPTMTSTTALPNTDLRNGDLSGLVELLQAQADVKYDVCVSANKLSYSGGLLRVADGAVRFNDEGAESADAVLAPTDVFEEGVSEKLGVPRAYLRRLRETGQRVTLGYTDVSLLDANVNGWLQSDPSRKFLVRGFRTDDPDAVGIGRALLSDRYAPIDNLDVLLAALDGVRSSGVHVEIQSANLTDRNMRVSVYSPEVSALAPVWLRNYRSPYTTSTDADGTVRWDINGRPEVWGGFEVRNSETGGGTFSIVPRILVPICRNGMTRTQDALRQVHLGGRLEEGVVHWSDDTRRTSIELVKAKARDAVTTFLDADYLGRFVDEIEGRAAVPVDDAVGTIERIGKVHAFSEAEQASILDCFIRSGDLTAGGVLNAVTAAAQRVDNPDRAAELEDAGFDVLATAARA